MLIGLDSPDDAAVYRLGDGRVVAATLDFFTPLVDGAEDFGAIAAANALSDLYAMNVPPAFALSVLAIPAGELPDEVVEGIFRGATELCGEAGISIAGGHSIDDKEPKFGLVALGIGDEDRLYRKEEALPDDEVVIGKALGTGVITTGIKSGQASRAAEDAAIRSMRRLNREAMDRLADFEVRAATDVTGFGLLGHLLEVCRASGTGAVVSASAPELLHGSEALAEAGCVPGGTGRNRKAVEEAVDWAEGVSEVHRVLLCDAQTSGGLLACVPAGEGDRLAAEWREAGYAASRVGRISSADGARIRVEA